MSRAIAGPISGQETGRTIAGSLELGIEIASEGGIGHEICWLQGGQRSGAGNAGGMIGHYHGR